MAGQAEKRRQKRYDAAVKLWGSIIGSLNLIFIIFRIFLQSEPLSVWNWLGFVLMLVIYLISGYFVVHRAAEDRFESRGSKTKPEQDKGDMWPHDLVILTGFVQMGSLYSTHFWWLMLAIPGVLLYKGGRMVLQYVFTPSAEELEDDDSKAKRLKKQERKQKKVRYIRR